MKAVGWFGLHDMRVVDVEQPDLLAPTDALVRVTHTAICGTDLHLYHAAIPGVAVGNVVGHEPLGIVEAVGPAVKRVRRGDRVVVAFPIACGQCHFCGEQLYCQCSEANPDGEASAIFGLGHNFGDYWGGQAEYIRVPYADVGLLPVPEDVDDEDALLLSDVAATGYFACDIGGVEWGDTVTVFGCGPVGLMAMAAARLRGAERIIAVDHLDYRLAAAERLYGAEPVNFKAVNPAGAIRDRTGGLGSRVTVDAVGLETEMSLRDKIEAGLKIEQGEDHAFGMAVQATRRGGTIACVGIYAGRYNQFPWGEVFAKNLTVRSGQCPVQRYWRDLMTAIAAERLRPSAIVTHRLSLSDAPRGYRIFDRKEDQCVKVVLLPGG